MGYTHYWTFKPAPKSEASKVEEKYQLAIRQCNRVIKAYNKQFDKGDYRRLSGFSAHCKTGQYGGIHINGSGDEAHEDFTLREHYSQNLESDAFNFCKTARKPYDDVVVACLIILKHYLKELIHIQSDGYADEWLDGKHLAETELRMRLTIPIQKKRIPIINPNTMYTR